MRILEGGEAEPMNNLQFLRFIRRSYPAPGCLEISGDPLRSPYTSPGRQPPPMVGGRVQPDHIPCEIPRFEAFAVLGSEHFSSKTSLFAQAPPTNPVKKNTRCGEKRRIALGDLQLPTLECSPPSGRFYGSESFRTPSMKADGLSPANPFA